MDIALDLAQKRKLPLPLFGQVDQMIKWFHADDVAARIEEATEHVPLDRLAVSPQCGFASGEIARSG